MRVHRDAVDDAHLHRAGVRNHEPAAVFRAGDPPRIRGGKFQMVERQRSFSLAGLEVDETHRVHVDPAPFDLAGRDRVASHGVQNVRELAVGRDANAAHVDRPVRKLDQAGFQRFRVDEGRVAGEPVLIRSGGVDQEVGNDQRLSVG